MCSGEMGEVRGRWVYGPGGVHHVDFYRGFFVHNFMIMVYWIIILILSTFNKYMSDRLIQDYCNITFRYLSK